MTNFQKHQGNQQISQKHFSIIQVIEDFTFAQKKHNWKADTTCIESKKGAVLQCESTKRFERD